MSNELQKQVTIDEAISEASRGQTSDRQDLVDRIREAVEKNLPKNKSFLYKAPSFDEFFTVDDYYHVLDLWLSLSESSAKYGRSEFYRRICYSGHKFFGIDLSIRYNTVVLECCSRDYTISIYDFFEKGFAYARDCIIGIAGLCIDEGHVFPRGVAALFPRTCAKIHEDLKGIQNGFLDLIVRLGDLRNFQDSIHMCGFSNLYDYCLENFGLCRTNVKNMLEIYDKFFERCVIKADYRDYSYSQLVELCSVDSKDLYKFDESMSVREIKAKKKELRELSESKVDENFVVSGVDKDNDGSFSSEEAECESDGEAGCNDVPALGFQAAIDAVKEMQNPYYVSGKEKQSARYDAYQNALHDVLEKLDEILSESLRCVVVPERHDDIVLLHGVVVGNPEA